MQTCPVDSRMAQVCVDRVLGAGAGNEGTFSATTWLIAGSATQAKGLPPPDECDGAKQGS